ncbi:exported hypothetical protein [Frankia sp. AiPs1]|uniref:allene oxide cyclase barrel-like domain-containing protein n=1 Tax=Frankia sp. AiPa1 TaxID=573492 RepID=UPI00202B42D8|nr:hypothetical protein [Frankia sp. AiPa1]MCL9760183.1 hypothetical protein [Frankia sp. AiPa1]
MSIRRSTTASALISGSVLTAALIAATRLLSVSPSTLRPGGTGATQPAAGTGSAEAADESGGLSVVHEGIWEPQIKNEQNVNVADPQVGQIGIYHDELYDSARELLGISIGRYEIRYKKVHGAVLTYYSEDLFLRDGVIHAEGWADFNDVKNGVWVGYPAVGLDGVYRGLDGRREWRVIEPDQPVEARIALYG